MSTVDVVVIGAGLSGLSCAHHLLSRGITTTVLEASDGVGGRVRTDEVEGFLLDYGFQVFLTAHPSARDVFDLEALRLRRFVPGAFIRHDGRMSRVGDPFRSPQHILSVLLADVGTLADKLRVLRLRAAVCHKKLEELFARPEVPTIDALRERYGFSDTFINRFFRPFLGGVFMDPNLETSSRVFEFVFRTFALGDASLPAAGMGAVPAQLASRLPAGTVRTGARVSELDGHTVRLESGECLTARAVVVATHGPEALRLLGGKPEGVSRGTVCLYFASKEPPLEEPILVLNGESRGPINNLCVPSNVAPTYAPKGQALISATVVGHPKQDDAHLEHTAREQLEEWFGPIVRDFRLLRLVRIDHALPDQNPGRIAWNGAREVRPDVFVCGDGRHTASFEGALASGRDAARAVQETLEGRANEPGPVAAQ